MNSHFLPFVKKDKINHLSDPTYKYKIDKIKERNHTPSEQVYDVTYLTSHLPQDILDKCFEMIDTNNKTKGFCRTGDFENLLKKELPHN